MSHERVVSRRSVVGALGTLGGLPFTTGCLGRSGVTGTSVEHIESRRNREQRPTIVAFDDEGPAVHVMGYMTYGSSSCNKVGLASTDYDAGAGTLRVTVESKSTSTIPFLPFACTADLASTWYRATVRFADADELPRQVTVVEQRGSNEEVRTVNRREQARLCTTDHPPDSEKAKTAHWTCPEQYVAHSTDES